jgi:CubicO group peptidase (beta-lactamase class C family)
MRLSSALVERVDAVFADMDKPQHPGAALLVIDHDERLYSKCYGHANLELARYRDAASLKIWHRADRILPHAVEVTRA